MKKQLEIDMLKCMATAVFAVVVFLFIVSCGKKDENLINMKFDPETMPSMVTDSAVQLISDSGRTRYKIVANVWEVYDKAKEPFSYFPEGFYLERFDEKFNVEATIIADTAWNYTAKKLWRIKGHVDIKNMQGHEFKSDELFWDQKTAKIYSDKYIEIKRGALELKGYGFESNQEMTDYRIMRPHDGKLPFEDEPAGPGSAQLQPDTIQ
ncbi:MAG TPA: LPS export ABC transporter periplasmic protein LptC [Petrimonas sp.]|uniref:LPS export ABC transporter periplasmic protein LptC n=1 Tax=Petrimonas sp. TaxID=2023866 RepID=UPI0017506CFD|nr:LPS export ABC transporter periplasmic protein LptC [Petrimonas sp.]MEA4980029.1 LPS export ABC transporter periplasmic protein LptC [Petrimonas sp.]MEA5044365.1 LPS export ABC transporter periplasmic protein LptC [Petrimonas sp.]MEA5063989.1 LPS export ABC transporter periplasmic protein LptC [Petrimonas sp.]HHV86803.1 LPS export ABC transporter periplasmic protein LptC [Petrimonas sp.]